MTSGRAPTEFPPSLGRVAPRELAAHRITGYAQLTAITRGDLLAIHGVGPKAVRLLAAELAARGLSFAGEPTGPATGS